MRNAHDLIAENKQTQAKSLNLARCGLRDWPKELFDCVWLEELVLSNRYYDPFDFTWKDHAETGFYNLLSHIPSKISQLKKLKKLELGGSGYIYITFGGIIFRDLWGIQDIDLNHLSSLKNLHSLNLSYTQVSDISVLQNLTQLQSLSLGSKVSDISVLQNLTQLQSLSLGSKVSDISVLQNLTQLQSLNLYRTQVSDISVLQNLTQLQSLNLYRTQVSDISVLQNLTQLQSLNLFDTQVSDISVLQNLTQLQSLSLGSKVSDISVLQNLTQLQSLSLGSKVSDISVLQNLTQLQSLNLYRTQVSDISVLQNLTQLQSIDLSYTQVSDISVLQNLTQLQSLNLYRTQVSDISVLQNLTQLQSLNLYRTQVSDISVLQNLTQLQSLSLGSKVSDISVLQNLTQLQSLSLGSKVSDISVLQNLTQLQSLSLGSKVSDISVLQNLTQLQSLSLGSKVSDISVLQNLTQLQSIDLSYTQVSDISVLQNLTQLQSLNLYRTQVSDISVLQNLTQLQSLNLYRTQVSDISVLQNLTQLSRIELQKSPITDLSPIVHLIENGLDVRWKENDYLNSGIVLYNNPLSVPPVEVAKQGREAILDYFHQLQPESVPVYEAKLLIVGEAGAGKTSLARRICNPTAKMPDEKLDTTRGIDIHPHTFKGQEDKPDFLMNIWDFGGQDIYHSTHQFFLSKRALYVLLLDGRTEESPNYWLQVQELRGKDSPMLILINKKGNIQPRLNFQELQELYPNLKDQDNIDLKNDEERIKLYQQTVEHYIRNLPQFEKGEVLPGSWVRIRDRMKKLAEEKNYIDIKAYEHICSDEGIKEKTSQDFLSDYLHDLGAFLHFTDVPILRKTIILNPSWATDAVYKILDHTQSQDVNGHFKKGVLKTVWGDPSYREMDEELLALMERFELCYKVREEDLFIVPALLNEDRPKAHYWTHEEGEKRLRYQYDFLPKGILTRLIVRLHPYIKDQKLVWRRGVVFEHNGARAEVIEHFRDKYIHINVQGANRRRMMTIIAEQLDEINRTFHFSERMQVRQLLLCPCRDCQENFVAKKPAVHFFKKEYLKRAQKKGRRMVECDESFEDIEVLALINDVFVSDDPYYRYKAEPEQNRMLMRVYLDDLIRDNKLKAFLEELQKIASGTDFENLCLMKFNQYTELSQNIKYDVLNEEEKRKSRNRLIKSSLDLRDDMLKAMPQKFNEMTKVRILIPDPVLE